MRLLPPELLGQPRGDLEQIPLAWLSREPEPEYRLDSGDILGIHIDGILGDADAAPPITVPEVATLPPAVGVPVPIREDGTLPLPRIEALPVAGMTVAEVEKAIIDVYSVKRKLVNPAKERIIVTLIRPRHERILVIRQDGPDSNSLLEGGGQIPSFRGLTSLATTAITQQKGTGTVVDLPADENDVLNALTRTGGLPGPAGRNEVIIQRGAHRSRRKGEAAIAESTEIIRIPLRHSPGAPRTFLPADVVLHTGDIVYVEARRAEVYYTAGLIPAREIPLPRDTDITVVEAISRVGGPLVNGGLNNSNLSGAIVGPGIGHPSPSLLSVLRRTSDGRQVNIRVDLNVALNDPRENILVMPGDVLVLQETPGEASFRYVTNVLQLGFIADLFRGNSGSATVSGSLP